MSGVEWAKARLAETVAAFALLTRLPVGLMPVPWTRELRHAAWAYPLVGAAVGLIGGLTYWIVQGLGVPPVLAAIFAIFATILATGALHEDGLVDAADGLGGKSPEDRLAIMRDHRIGTYGALALVLSLGIRIAAIALLAEPALVIGALIATGAASRASATALMAALAACSRRRHVLARRARLDSMMRLQPSRSPLRSHGSPCPSYPRLASIVVYVWSRPRSLVFSRARGLAVRPATCSAPPASSQSAPPSR